MNQGSLPFDKREYRARMEAVETIGSDELTPGQLKKVRFLVKFVFKHRRSSAEGDLTFVQSGSGFNLASELEVSKRTLANWLAWAKSIGVIELSVDCDGYRNRRSTLSICWNVVLKSSRQSATDARSQSATVARQSASVARQSATVSRQSATVARCLNTKNQYPTSTSEEGEGFAKAFALLRDAELSAASADRIAKRHTLEQIEWMLRTYRANRDVLRRPGAIVHFADHGEWPDDRVTPALTSAELRKRDERKRQIRSEQDAAIERERAAEAVASERRMRLGPVLDAMPQERQESLARDLLDDFSYRQWMRKPDSPLWRDQLLVALDATDGVVIDATEGVLS